MKDIVVELLHNSVAELASPKMMKVKGSINGEPKIIIKTVKLHTTSSLLNWPINCN